MNELTLAMTDPMPLAVAPPSQVSFIEIRRHPDIYPRITKVPTPAAQKAMEQIIFRAMFYKAASSLKDDDFSVRISLMASELLQLLLDDEEGLGMNNLSFAEIARVIRTACVSSKKEMYGVTVAGLYQAIADYCINEGHEASKVIREEKWAARQMQSSKPVTQGELIDIDFDKALAEMAARHNLNGKY